MKVTVKYKDIEKSNEEIDIEELEDIYINYNRELLIDTNKQDEIGKYKTLFIDMNSIESIEITDL